MKNKMIYTVLFMVLITSFYTSILAIMNDRTDKLIQANQILREQKSILYVLNIPYSENDTTESIQTLYQKHISYEEQQSIPYYVGKTSDDRIIGYAFPFVGNGLWGKIEGYLALSEDMKTMIGIDFTSHSETPGLGGRISESWFKEQFRNIPLNDSSYFIAFNSQESKIDSISGATQTSQAVENMINKNISIIYENLAVK